MATTSAQVQQLYVAYLGRAADKGGLDYWLGQLNAEPAQITLDQIRTNFVNEQPEYAAAYAGLSRVDTVTKIYNNLFGRAPDAGGLTYWTTGGGATVALDQLLVAFVNGASATDAQVVTNKVLVSEVYTSTAGANYAAADAKAIISGVNDTTQSVTDAVAKLSDGSLSGIAVPASVGLLKASVAADAAVSAYETTKAADLLAIEKQLATLSTTSAVIKDQTVTSTANSTYSDVNTELKADLADARAQASAGNVVGLDGKSTLTLTGEATVKAAALTAAADTLRLSDDKSVEKTGAYDTAAKALAAAKEPNAADVTQAKATLVAYANNPANATVWDTALSDAGVTKASPADVAADVDSLYTVLTTLGTSTTLINKVTADFAGVTAFTSFGSLAAQELTFVKATDAFNKADTALANQNGSTAASDWKAAYAADASVKLQVEASKALDAIEASYKAIDTAHTALTTAQTAAADKLAGTSLVALNTKAAPDTFVAGGTADKADVFYFTGGKVTTADGALTFETAKDSLYIGDGYTLNTTAKFDAATGTITGGQNGVKEVFFFKDGSNIKAVIEAADLGSSTFQATVANGTSNLDASASDQVSIITLTGITSVDQLSFANGVITAHA
ncbi:putative uncharacterized protein [Pseudomonas sp. StFLB209]|nr:putative uncharacterized protein [Pseudomonas sp. StFLB209]